jgi:rsbT antagonist protein RsbS
MAERVDVARVPLQISQGCIVASIQVDLSDDVLAQFRVQLLDLLQQTGLEAVILDVSGISVMDLEEFQALRDTMTMAKLMGARTIFSGFQPGVVSALIELNAQTDDIDAAFNLDSAFALLAPADQQAPEPEPGKDEDEADIEVVDGGD